MKKNKKILILLFAFCGVFTLSRMFWNNGSFRTILRAITNERYSSEIKRITDGCVEFDISRKKPAILAFGLRYPKSFTLKEIEGYTIKDGLKIKVIKNGKIIESEDVNKTDKNWLDFNNTGYQVTEFYKFVWSPKIFMRDNVNISIDFNDKFVGYDVIVFDTGIK